MKLNEILLYKNDKTIRRFLRMYDVSLKEAQDIFKETLKYLYLCAYTENKRKEYANLPSLAITFQILVIDEMWHAFILNTRDYQEFCNTYFSEFVHHPPSVYGRNRDTNNEAKEIEAFRNTVSYIYDVLGEKTALKWFSTYAEQYSIKKLKELSRGL